MAVFRVERTQNYTVMSNYHLRDRRLSLKAKGLLSLMLSLPEDWDYTLSGLARISLEGNLEPSIICIKVPPLEAADLTSPQSGCQFCIEEVIPDGILPYNLHKSFQLLIR